MGGKKLKGLKKQLTMLLQQGPRRESEVRDAILLAGYSQRTYWRARKALRIQTQRSGWGESGYWEISLPGWQAKRYSA